METVRQIGQDVNRKSRLERQEGVVPDVGGIVALVAGVGAVGRNVAVMLAQMGIGGLVLVDPDTVEAPNVATQGYPFGNIGMAKVDSCYWSCQNVSGHSDAGLPIKVWRDVFKRKHLDEGGLGVVFTGVDTMKATEKVWRDSRESKVPVLVDARLVGEVIRVVTCADGLEGSWEAYKGTLFGEDEAFRGPAGRCTTRMTGYCAAVAGGLAVGQWVKWVRWHLGGRQYGLNGVIQRDFMLDMTATVIEDMAATGTRRPDV